MNTQSRLGLNQTYGTPGPARVRGTSKAPPKREGKLWATVQVVTEHPTSPSLKCINCGATFCGGATRIREHITGGGNITACTCDTDAFLDLKQTMIEESSGKQDAKK